MWDSAHNTTTDTADTDMEEGLAIRSVPFPTPPQQRQANAPQEVGLVNALASAIHFDGHVLAATDGGATTSPLHFLRRAGIGIAIQCLHRTFRCGNTVKGADQSPWAAEISALIALLRAAKAAGVNLHVLIDNRSVAYGFWSITQGKLPNPPFAFMLWQDVHHLAAGMQHT